jgi:hypothetical protein
LYVFNLGDRIPAFPLPLKADDVEPVVDLQSIVDELYNQLGYDYFIDYTSDPPTPCLPSDIARFVGSSK